MKPLRAFLILLLMTVATSAPAVEWMTYDSQGFDQLSKAGRAVVLDVHADWCPTCQRQQPALRSAVSKQQFAQYVVMVVDFDHPSDALRRFRISQQSTLVVFNGTQERGRASGITEPEDIDALLRKGLQ